VPDGNRNWPNPDQAEEVLDALPHGMPIAAPPVLFQKIEDDMVAEWTEKFGGES
jgi:methionyl-tRNA synthetase